MQDSIPDRYGHNPMLVLVENYILDAIGLLETKKADTLNVIVCRTFGGTDWRKTLASQLQLPADTPASLKKLWKQRQEEAAAKQEDLTPELFAQQIADELLADLGNP
jgi:hypothetical protein